jgi:hypothetical protein
MIESGEAHRPFAGAEALAVRAIVSLSRTGSRTAKEDARKLMSELNDLRRGPDDKLQARHWSI